MHRHLKYFLYLSFVAWLGSLTIIMPMMLLNPVTSLAQRQDEQSDLTIDATTRSQVIEGILKSLNDY